MAAQERNAAKNSMAQKVAVQQHILDLRTQAAVDPTKLALKEESAFDCLRF